jgi:hypothetical protein
MENKEDISCEKYQIADKEYSRLHEFLDNLPYMIMIILGAAVLFMGFETLVWKWVTSGLYLFYGVIGAAWIILFVCPYCHFFDTRLCPCGYGKIAAKFRQKKDDSLFTRKFKNHIPVIVPLWIIPTVAGIVFLISKFSLLVLVLLVLFAINSYVLLPLISTKYGCTHCPQKDKCPWMKYK